MSLAWLTLIGAAIESSRAPISPLPVFVHRLPETTQLWIRRFNHALIAGVGLLVAWYGWKLPAQQHVEDARAQDQPRLALRVLRGRRHLDRDIRRCDGVLAAAAIRIPALGRPFMLLASVAAIFVALILLSMPIVFALGVAGIGGLWIGGYPMQQLLRRWSRDRKAGCCRPSPPSCSPAI